MNIVNVKSLNKKFKKKTAITDLSFDVKEGEIFALLGTNGAGKSTAIRIMTGMLNPTHGEIAFFNLEMNENWKLISNQINIVPQETAVAENLTVKQNLDLIYDLYGLDKTRKDEVVNSFINRFEINEEIKTKAIKLSGGTRQKLSIAMALMTNPKIVFLDEPTTGLDVITRKLLWNQLLEYKKKNKLTIILTTHYLQEAVEYADRVAIMDKSHLKIIDTVPNIIKLTKTTNFDDAFIKITKGE